MDAGLRARRHARDRQHWAEGLRPVRHAVQDPGDLLLPGRPGHQAVRAGEEGPRSVRGRELDQCRRRRRRGLPRPGP